VENLEMAWATKMAVNGRFSWGGARGEAGGPLPTKIFRVTSCHCIEII